CASQQYILGTEVESFERDLADFSGAKEAVGCASGTDALWLALVTAGVQPGDQVLTTPFSFFASASAIARVGARPVFADINAATFNLDPTQVELGWNTRRDAMQAAILHVKLKYLEGWNQARRQRAAVYDKLFAEAGLTVGQRSQSHAAKPGSEPTSVSQSTLNNQQSTISANPPVQSPQT